jgi:hypothetical protein
MILDTYDESDLFTQNTDESFAVHTAASWANLTALKLIRLRMDDYTRRNSKANVSIAQLANMEGNYRATALDQVVSNLTPPGDHDQVEEYPSFFEPRRMLQRQSAALECYKILRELGAMHRVELKGWALRQVCRSLTCPKRCANLTTAPGKRKFWLNM